ncbi:MAG: YbaK/EbsC family protein [bacterium]|nr:YbaK/EbsC family protein [bacterium]
MNVTEKISLLLENKIPYMIEPGFDDKGASCAEEHFGETCGCLAKSVAVNVDGKVYMVVIPATEQVNLRNLEHYLGAENARLATEAECRPIFSDCDEGATPIFGSLYGLPVLVAHELTDNEEIAFPAGTSRDFVRMRLIDYLITEKPCVCARNAIINKPS